MQSEDALRKTRRIVWLENLWMDLQSGARGLVRSPLFSATVIATLALGIGATSALFGVVDSALLRPLGGVDPDRLVFLQEFSAQHEASGGNPPRFADWQQARSFRSWCGLYSDSAIYIKDGSPIRLQMLHTMGDPYPTLTPRLVMGRPFTASENRGEGQPVAMLTAAAWKREFGGDPNILKRHLTLGAADYQVVGVLDSSEAGYPEDTDVWVPASGDVAHAPREAGFLGEIGRLSPEATLDGAQAEINVLAGRMGAQYPATDAGRSAALVPLQTFVSKSAETPLLTLLAAAGAVLLIACVNIAGLLIARGLARQREAAIRISVGAGFFRLARLFFAESLLLAACGWAIGLAVAYGCIGILKVTLPPDIPHLATVSLDWRVVACAAAVAGLSALLFGLAPAWQFAVNGQSSALKSGGRGTTDGGRNRLRAGLVVVEVALSLALLVTAGMLANSFFQMRNQPGGFNPVNAYSFAVPFGWDSDPAMLNSFASGALTRLTTSPGVLAAGVVDQLPLHGGSQSGRLVVEGAALDPMLAEKQFSWRTASAGYFSAIGVSVKAGSLYRDWMGGKGEKNAVITDRLAAVLFPQGDAIGHLIAQKSGARVPNWFRIVGVVSSVRLNPTDTATEAGVYVPWGATYWPGMHFVVKSTGDLSGFTRLVRNHIQTLTEMQTVEKIDTLEALTAQTRSNERVRTILLATFAGLALTLSAIGLFGILTHEVARRTQDYGVRLALGAEPSSIAWMAVKSALALAAMGVVIGIGVSVWSSQFLQGLLFGVETYDLGAYFWAVVVLLGTAVLAALVPAIRAARIDPISALRHE